MQHASHANPENDAEYRPCQLRPFLLVASEKHARFADVLVTQALASRRRRRLRVAHLAEYVVVDQIPV